jgi:hypothetical protein
VGKVVHVYNLTQKAMTGEFQVQRQPRQQGKTLFPKKEMQM